MQIKKIVRWTLFLFLVYAIVTSPDKAAGLVDTVWDILVTGLQNVGNFFDALINRN
jgi:hypothetical protein